MKIYENLNELQIIATLSQLVVIGRMLNQDNLPLSTSTCCYGLTIEDMKTDQRPIGKGSGTMVRIIRCLLQTLWM